MGVRKKTIDVKCPFHHILLGALHPDGITGEVNLDHL